MKRFPRVADRIVLNVRGTNGSGKSTVIFDLIKKFGKTDLLGEDGKAWAYKLKCYPPLFIVGRYDSPTGGCDTIRTMDIICARVQKLSKMGDVIFEGLLISGFHGRWVELEKSLPRCKFIYGVLDTPIEICIKRVIARRKAMGNEKDFDPKNLIAKDRSVKSSRLRLIQAGCDVRTLPYQSSTETILAWRREGWIRFPRE